MSAAEPDMIDSISGNGMPARRAAFAILCQVLLQKKMLDHVLDREPSFKALPALDRGFVRMLVATALRRKGQIDDIITRACDRRDALRPETLRIVLMIGVAQILFMDVADHAAVDTSVSLAGAEGLESKKGFVNAVLRRVTADGQEWLAGQDPAALNIPPWIYAQWSAAYGATRARDIALASLEEAALDITLKHAADAQSWVERLDGTLLLTGSLRRSSANVPELDGFEDGDWWVQDASSAIPARLLGDISGRHVLDLCAAPGGKTMQLASMGAQVTALDRSAARMALLKDNLKRARLSDSVVSVIGDGAEWQPREKLSHILLDAPCTATGTLRRHPDLLHLKDEKDQAGLCGVQARLLGNASRILDKGGILVYCTCSLQKEEGERQVDRFLREDPSMRRVAIRKDELPGLDGAVNSDGDVRVLPYYLKEQGGMDGFYVARLQKIN